MQARTSENDSVGAIVDVVLKVAETHRSRIPLADLMELLPEGTTPDQAAAALDGVSGLGPYVLQDGVLMPKGDSPSRLQEFRTRLDNSRANLALAKWFAAKLSRTGVLALAVSGSTSYKAASDRDDVDFFCLTKRGEMWVFLARALVLTRVLRLSKAPIPPVCLSCVMDEGYARRIFAEDGGALFARDALVAEPVLGAEEYRRLLGSARWMGSYFPKLYRLRGEYGRQRARERSAGVLSRLLNLLLYAILGTYVRSKSRYHNAELARVGKMASRFRAKVGPDHLIYESARYLTLKGVYEDIQPIERPTSEAPVGTGKDGSGLAGHGSR